MSGSITSRYPVRVSSVDRPTPDVGEIEFGAEELTMARYREEGTRRALELDNRGPARFGIAQRPPLRGRLGRGAHASRCRLVGEAPTPDAGERLKALVRTTDGFELAEVDLDLRGEGTIMGERQKGRNDLRLASRRRDREWVEAARQVALDLVGDGVADGAGDGSGLDAHPELADEVDAVATVVSAIDMESDAEFTVIEVRDARQAVAAARTWDKLQVERGGCEKIVLLLDNRRPDGCAKAHASLIQEDLRAWCILEGSGGLARVDLEQWVESGVDLVSTRPLRRYHGDWIPG